VVRSLQDDEGIGLEGPDGDFVLIRCGGQRRDAGVVGEEYAPVIDGEQDDRGRIVPRSGLAVLAERFEGK
jgi:hypothetical protein